MRRGDRLRKATTALYRHIEKLSPNERKALIKDCEWASTTNIWCWAYELRDVVKEIAQSFLD